MVHLRGDIDVHTAKGIYGQLRGVGKRRDVKHLVVDFSGAGRVDSSGVAVVTLLRRQLEKSGKRLEVTDLDDRQRAAFDLAPDAAPRNVQRIEMPTALEVLGERVLTSGGSVRDMAKLVGETVRQGAAVVTRRKHLPSGSITAQLANMGVGAVFIVGLLSFLLGMTLAFQGAVQLARFGAGVFVADMIGMSMVREIAPMMTAVILTGRTGAAIAAELGTMRVRSEIDALSTMGVNPVRFLIVPRLAAITLAGPALTLMSMAIGMLGGLLVANLMLDLPAVTFWQRITERVVFLDFVHGMGKSFVFAWIIGFTASHLGMRAGGDASSVGAATTRTVVVSIFAIIVVDAVFATISTFMRYG